MKYARRTGRSKRKRGIETAWGEAETNLGFLQVALLQDLLDDGIVVLGAELALLQAVRGLVECALCAVSGESRMPVSN